MKNVIKLLASMTLVLFVAVSMNAQTATTVAEKSETKNCDVTKCDPAKCDAMVKAGLCTKEQAAQCKAKCSKASTKVAAASMEKGVVIPFTSSEPVKKASCAKTCTGKKKAKAE